LRPSGRSVRKGRSPTTYFEWLFLEPIRDSTAVVDAAVVRVRAR
jgi:hypothetical protein